MIVGILGANYCGSTAMGKVLSTHPDFVTIGEAAILTTPFYKADRAVSAIGCGDCSRKNLPCPVFNPSDFPYDPKTLHQHVVNVTGAKYVVDTSKDVRAFQHYPEGRYILMFKDPDAAIASMEKHYTPPHPVWDPTFPGSLRGDEAAKAWVAKHERMIRFLKKKMFFAVSYRSFSESPAVVMERIAFFLGTDNQFVLEGRGNHHGVSGNHAVSISDEKVMRKEGVPTWKISTPVRESMKSVYNALLSLEKQ